MTNSKKTLLMKPIKEGSVIMYKEFEEIFPYHKSLEGIDNLLDAKEMFRDDYVAPWIKDFVMQLEKHLLKQVQTGQISTEDIISMMISLFAFVIHYIKETGKSINMDDDTLKKFYLIMEYYNPKLMNPVTQDDYKNQIDEFNVILSKVIKEKASELGLDDEETGTEYHYHES